MRSQIIPKSEKTGQEIINEIIIIIELFLKTYFKIKRPKYVIERVITYT